MLHRGVPFASPADDHRSRTHIGLQCSVPNVHESEFDKATSLGRKPPETDDQPDARRKDQSAATDTRRYPVPGRLTPDGEDRQAGAGSLVGNRHDTNSCGAKLAKLCLARHADQRSEGAVSDQIERVAPVEWGDATANRGGLRRIEILAGIPETRPSLLVRIRDPADAVAWRDFVAIYTPLIYNYARRRGLQDADAADVGQTVLQSIARSIDGFEYDPQRGTFRSWLYTITRNQVAKLLQRRQKLPVSLGADSLEVDANHGDGDREEQRWNREHEQHLFHWAADKVRHDFEEQTWQAFWRVAVDGQAVADTAKSLGMTPGAIYIAKSRVTARLRQLIDSVERD